MKTTTITFINRPNSDGTVSTFSISGCLIAQNGSPTTRRPQILIHLPKKSDEDVNGSWVTVENSRYHVIGTTIKSMDDNTPTEWNRYCIAEKIY